MGWLPGRSKGGLFKPNRAFDGLDLTDFRIKGLEENILLALKGTVAAPSFPHNIITLTEQAAAYAKVEDGGVFLNLAVSAGGAGYTANYQLFPDTEVIGDAVYFGAAAPFGAIFMDMSATVQTYANDALIWEYWNGTSWTTLTLIWDATDGTAQDGKRSFGADGYIIFSAPTDWKMKPVDGQSAYWIRARVTAAQITQIGLTNSKEHQIPSAAAASEVPADGIIGRGRITWTTVSGANNDTIFTLLNLTSGACSALKTLTQATIEQEVADFALTVSKDDALALFYTQEDGTTEFANGIAELRLART